MTGPRSYPRENHPTALRYYPPGVLEFFPPAIHTDARNSWFRSSKSFQIFPNNSPVYYSPKNSISINNISNSKIYIIFFSKFSINYISDRFSPFSFFGEIFTRENSRTKLILLGISRMVRERRLWIDNDTLRPDNVVDGVSTMGKMDQSGRFVATLPPFRRNPIAIG